MISRCPSCGFQVDDEAARCPNCHWDFKLLKRVPPPGQAPYERPSARPGKPEQTTPEREIVLPPPDAPKPKPQILSAGEPWPDEPAFAIPVLDGSSPDKPAFSPPPAKPPKTPEPPRSERARPEPAPAPPEKPVPSLLEPEKPALDEPPPAIPALGEPWPDKPALAIPSLGGLEAQARRRAAAGPPAGQARQGGASRAPRAAPPAAASDAPAPHAPSAGAGVSPA